ncbi:MAG: chorismate synthase [Candidatus Electrothrix sp. YB6]
MEILGGPLFGVAGAGESHGPAFTTIVFGCPPGVRISRQRVQKYLDRRRPGSNKYGTTRQEGDNVAFLSGIYAEGEHDFLLSGPDICIQVEGERYQTETYEGGYTTGEPISAVVLSASKISRHYQQFVGSSGEVRPGHTGLVKHYKSKGFVDVRGGGRSSYRSTISDVIGGSIARIFLKKHFDTVILSSICQVGPLKASQSLATHFEQLILNSQSPKVSSEEITRVEEKLAGAEIYSLDTTFALEAAKLIEKTHEQGDSLGATLEVVALNVPPLVGEPLYQSLKLRLMGILGGVNAAQFCEVGGGSKVVGRLGSENNDPIRRSGYQANSHGGVIGGITTGMPLVFRVGFKPTSTINKPQLSVCKDLKEIDFIAEKGRHDPCVGVRAGVTLESRMAIELMNAVLMHQSHQLNTDHFELF